MNAHRLGYEVTDRAECDCAVASKV